jgi:sugar lactone lactonase YvrE
VRSTGFLTPNGMAFSPDGRTMYLSDSHPHSQQVWAFDYDAATGTPRNRRLFIDMRPVPGRPDGAAVDADGCYWICGNDAGLVHRFTPDGRLDRSLAVPVKKPAMCAFGGAGLDTLFVTSIRPGGDLSDQPLAGGLFALRPGVRGLAEPACTVFPSPPHPPGDSMKLKTLAVAAAGPLRHDGRPGHRIPLVRIHPDDYPTTLAVKFR